MITIQTATRLLSVDDHEGTDVYQTASATGITVNPSVQVVTVPNEDQRVTLPWPR